MDQEVHWWRAHHFASTVLIGLADGDLAWDDTCQALNPTMTTALPPSALGWFTHELLWIDLRWACQTRHVSLRNPRFRECLTDLAAPIRGLPKDELIGEDVRQHRRTRRLARSLVTALMILAVVAAGFAIAFLGQRTEARVFPLWQPMATSMVARRPSLVASPHGLLPIARQSSTQSPFGYVADPTLGSGKRTHGGWNSIAF